jgi:hypothetical protein
MMDPQPERERRKPPGASRAPHPEAKPADASHALNEEREADGQEDRMGRSQCGRPVDGGVERVRCQDGSSRRWGQPGLAGGEGRRPSPLKRRLRRLLECDAARSLAANAGVT